MIMALLVSQGCKKERHEDDNEIRISASIGNLSKVASGGEGSQYFEENDEISVYAWIGEKAVAPAATDRIVNNSINKLSAGVWTATPQMLWSTLDEPHYFIGIYPKRDNPVDNLAADPFTLSETEPAKNDLLVATNYDGLTGNMKKTVPLMFDHVMAKVIVNLEFRNQWGGGAPTVASVKLLNCVKEATVNYLDKTVSVDAGAGREELFLKEESANRSYSYILVPQNSINTVIISIEGKDYTYTSTDDFVIESGKYTTINLIVGRDRIDISSITINDWKEGSRYSGGEALD